MPEFPISDEAAEAAIAAHFSAGCPTDLPCMEDAIRAFLAAEGFTVDDDQGHNSMQRLIGPWRPKS